MLIVLIIVRIKMTTLPRTYPITGLFIVLDTKTGKIMTGAKFQRVFNSVSGSKTSARNTYWFREWQRNQLLRSMGYGCLINGLEKALEDAEKCDPLPDSLRSHIFRLQQHCRDNLKEMTFSTQQEMKITFKEQTRFVVEEVTSLNTLPINK